MFKVVVVEDEELLRMGLTGFFDWKEYGFELAGQAGNGLSGLEVIREVRPDLIITDIKMPHMDGIEMTERVKEEMPDVQVLVISGYDEFEYAKRALKAGVSEYILKPIRMDDLKEAVKRIQQLLSRRKKEEEELEQLKSSHQKSRQVRKAAFLDKVLLKGEDPAEAEQELREEFDRKVFFAGIISLQNFAVLYMDCEYSVIMEKDRELGRIIEQCLQKACSDEDRKKTELLRVNNGERLLCLCADSAEEALELKNRIEKGITGEKPEVEQLDICFGQMGVGLEGLAISFRSARKRNEEHFMRSWQDAAGGMEKDGGVSFLNYDVSDLVYEIRNGTAAGVRKEMEALRKTLSAENISSYIQLVLIVSNIYYELIRIPEEAGGSAEEVIPDSRALYQQMITRMKREEILNELESLCLKLHEYFQQFSGDRKHEALQRADSYIRENYSKEDLSMKDVAEHVFISVSYLGMIMKKETGKTFTEYLTDIRMEKAKQMLSGSRMKNYEIAEACGYTTPAYFSTVFKGATGMTPTEYRNKMK